MPVRKPTLAEWFFVYIHTKIWSEGFYVPLQLDVDVTEIVKAYSAPGEKTPYTAILTKAAALMLAEFPVLNRLVVNTFYGTRIIDLPEIRVCLPVMFEHEGKTQARLEVMKSPQALSVKQIREKLRDYKNAPVPPLTTFSLSHANHFFNRLYLRLGCAILQHVPRVMERLGGGVGLSSLLNLSEPGLALRAMAIGPTALTFTATQVETTSDGRTILRLGVGYNHLVCRGDEAFVALRYFSRLLTGQTPLGLAPFLPE